MDGQATGSFQDWLNQLPTEESLAPAWRKGYGDQHRAEAQKVPAMWLSYARQGEPLINQGYAAQRRSTIAGAGNARREFERSLLNAYQSSGVSPLYARSNLAQSMPQLGYQTEQQLGGIESQRLEDIFGFRTGIQNALAQGYGAERQFAEMLSQAYKARRSTREAQQFAQQMALTSAGFTLGGSYVLGRTGSEGEGGNSGGSGLGGVISAFL